MKSTKDFYNLSEYGSQTFDRFFGLCPDGIVCKDSEFRYISVNKSYCDLFLLKEASLIEGKLKNDFLSENNIKLVHDADNEVKKGLYPINYVINIEDKRILNVTSSPIIKDKIFIGIISIIRDITQEENIKEDFVNKHFEHINNERNLQSQREIFVASVGHDLKNPTIAQIRGLELLLKGVFGELNSEQRELLEMILDSCRYMNGMLSSLLETYRNYGGVIRLNFEEFLFTELVKECVSEMIYVAKDKGIKIITSFDSETVSVEADRVQIKRVLMNLLSNGIKYAFKDTQLNLFINAEDENLDFCFQNESPYIPEEKQKAIFARYVSYASAHNELGIGLGLYASKKIIESHSGHIYVKSFENNKNIFGFKIPFFQTKSVKKELTI